MTTSKLASAQDTTSIVVQRKSSWIEILLVVVTGVSKFIFVDYLQAKGFFVIAALTFWLFYVLAKAKKNKLIWKHWGFTYAGFWKSFAILSPLAILSITIFLVYGIQNKTALFHWHIIPTMLLYPLWGIIQQFLMMALIAGNLQLLSRGKWSRLLITCVTAIVFAIVHLPSLHLTVATFLLAILYVFVYFKYKNLFALGIYHGWLGCFFYYFVLKRDAWAEFIARFIALMS